MMNNAISYMKLNHKSKALLELQAIIHNEEEKKLGDAEKCIQKLPNLLDYSSNHATHTARYYIYPAVSKTFQNLLYTVKEAINNGDQPAEIHLTILKHFVKYLPEMALSIFHPDEYVGYQWSPALIHLLNANLVVPTNIVKIKLSSLLNPDSDLIPAAIYPWFTGAIEAGLLRQHSLDAKNVAEDLSSCRFFSESLKKPNPSLNNHVLEYAKFNELKQVAQLVGTDESRISLQLKINELLIQYLEEVQIEQYRTQLMITSIPGATASLQTIEFHPAAHPALQKVLPPANIATLVTEYGYGYTNPKDKAFEKRGYSNDLEHGKALCAAEAKKTPTTEAEKVSALAQRATRYGHLLGVLDKNTASIVEEYSAETPADESTRSTTASSLR